MTSVNAIEEFFTKSQFDVFIGGLFMQLEVRLDRRLQGIEKRLDELRELTEVRKHRRKHVRYLLNLNLLIKK